MRKTILLLAFVLAAPSYAGAFAFTGFAELNTRVAESELASASRLMDILSQFLGPEEQPGFPISGRDFTLIAASGDATAELARRAPAFVPLAKTGSQAIKSDEAIVRFEEARAMFCALLASAAKADPANKQLRMMADWGVNTWVQLDPAIDQHSEPILSRALYGELKLR